MIQTPRVLAAVGATESLGVSEVWEREDGILGCAPLVTCARVTVNRLANPPKDSRERSGLLLRVPWQNLTNMARLRLTLLLILGLCLPPVVEPSPAEAQAWKVKAPDAPAKTKKKEKAKPKRTARPASKKPSRSTKPAVTADHSADSKDDDPIRIHVEEIFD